MALNYRIIKTNADPARYVRTTNLTAWKYSLSADNPLELFCLETSGFADAYATRLHHDIIFIDNAFSPGVDTPTFSDLGMAAYYHPTTAANVPYAGQNAAFFESLNNIEDGSLEKVRSDGWTNAYASVSELESALTSSPAVVLSSAKVILSTASDPSTITFGGGELLAFYDIDVNLQTLFVAQGIDATPFRKIKINPTYQALYPYIWLKLKFVGDYIQSLDFNQDLHETAFVNHKQLEAEAIRNFLEANGKELTINRILLDYDSQYDRDSGIIGDMLTSVKVAGTDERQHFLATAFLKKLYAAESFIGVAQPLFSTLTDGIVTSERAKGPIVLNSDWTTWKARGDNFIVGFKYLNKNDVSYSDISVGNNIVNHAALMQFCKANKEWQIGDGEELNIYQAYFLSTNGVKQYNSGLNTEIKATLPVIMREFPQAADDIRSNSNDNIGYIPFVGIYNKSVSSNANIEGRSLDSNANYKTDIKKIYDVHTKFFVELSGGNKYILHAFNSIELDYDVYKSRLTQNSLDLGIDTAVSTPPSITDMAYIALRKKLYDGGDPANLANIGAKTKIVRDVGSPKINYTSYITDLAIAASFDIDVTNKINIYDYEMTFASAASNPLTRALVFGDIGKTADLVVKLYGDQLEIGRKGISADDDVTTKVYTRSYFNRAIKIYNATYSIPSAYPALQVVQSVSGISESGAFEENVDANYAIATIGYIKSPTITDIWKYIRQIISGGYMTQSGNPCAAPENETLGSWVNPNWTVASSDIWTEIDAEIAAVLGATWKTDYSSYLPTGSSFQMAAAPLSLRALEKKQVIDRYNIVTYINYTRSQLVEKGTTDNVGGGTDENRGTLYQLHKECTRWAYSGNPYSLADNEYSSYSNGGASQVYLGADGEWHYLFLNTKVPIINE